VCPYSHGSHIPCRINWLMMTDRVISHRDLVWENDFVTITAEKFGSS